MQCRVCGSQIPDGASACPVCGTPVQAENNASQIPPTVYSPQPGQSPSNYSGSSFNQPPPTNQYNQYPPAPPSPPAYNQVEPTRYAPPSSPTPAPAPYSGVNQPSYGPPAAPNNFNNNQYGNNAPPYIPNAPMPGQQYGAPQGPKKRSPWLWIILGIVAVVVLACGGGTYALIRAGGAASQTDKNATATATQPTPTVGNSQTVPTQPQATPTSATTNTGTSPSGNTVNPAAAQIITNAQTATDVDQTTAAPLPGKVTTSFTVNQTIYLTFKLNLNGIDVNTQKLYVYTLFYDGSIPVAKGDPLLIDKQDAPGGEFRYAYDTATQQGGAELYLCHQADCSDKALAQAVSFTVSD
jgi:hypothetical protein